MIIDERKLATIRTIEEIRPIEDADRIEHYRVDGWWVVDRKGAYNLGDRVIYCEVDSFIPHTLAPFLSKGKEPREYNGIIGERLKTIKLRGALSQGLLLPLDVLDIGHYETHQDVSEELGIIKWERPIPAQLRGSMKGNFPSWIPKTNQERIQNLSHRLEELSSHYWEITEKLDGSSMTVYLSHEGEFGVCSRNINLKETEDNTYWRVARELDLEEKMRTLNLLGHAIQGELIGPGIQGNKYKLDKHEFAVFDIVQNGQYLSIVARHLIVNMCGLIHAPIEYMNEMIQDFTVESLLEMAEGKSLANPKQEREGLVFKSTNDPSVSFKAISNRFLLKEKD